jgi:hypothetical protein
VATVEQDLVRSAMMARDVIESYRQSRVTVPGWSLTLEEAARSLARISAQRPIAGEAVPLSQLAQALSVTAKAGLHADRKTLDQLGRELRAIVADTRVPGIPRRADEDWSF